MTLSADIAIVVTSFERPANLRRSLLSLSLQASLECLDEIVVADDGSRDETWDVVDAFARRTGLPIAFTTHGHNGFQPGRARNEGALASSAPYLIYMDGDCVVPPNCVTTHVERRRKRVALCGESLRLTQLNSEKVTDETIRHGDLYALTPESELSRYATKARRDRIYSFLRVPMRPRLTGNHFSVWREDFERVGGFDLSYRGWGFEDCDLQRRLCRAGVRCKTVLPKTASFHLWHPPVESFEYKARNTPNALRYRQPVPSDNHAYSGLNETKKMPFSVWRWRNGTLVERPQGEKAALSQAAAG